jgi:hypothetical protein
VKKLLLENLATKAMAVLLAFLTWIYLFTQGNGTAEIEVEFQPPRLDDQVFSSVEYTDSRGAELAPGGSLRVRLSGPRVDVRNTSLQPPRTYLCKLSLDPGDLKDMSGSYPLSLDHGFIGLPNTITVEPLPSSKITVKYVKYRVEEVALVAPRPPFEGQPQPGYLVEPPAVFPTRIRVKVPANLTAIESVPIRSVPVAGRVDSFTLERWELAPETRKEHILPLDSFRVDIKIVPAPARRKLTLDLNIATLPEYLHRIELDTRSIGVELRGPQALVQAAGDRAAAVFFPYVVVTPRDMETAGPKNINESAIGCQILDPNFRGKIEVVIMPDEKPENRQVKIKVK